MTVSKLSLYRGALTVLGERKLDSLTEDVPPRYKLDDVWDNDAVKRCLQHGQWNFAMRTLKLDSSPDISPSFGYQFAFDKPSDHIRTTSVAEDEYFRIPLTNYFDEAGWWFSDRDPIYARYVSSDSQYGLDYTLWPENFTEYVEHYIAYKVAPLWTGVSYAEDGDKADKKIDKMLMKAQSTDAMEDPARFLPMGTWSRSRRGHRQGDRGNRRQLIG